MSHSTKENTTGNKTPRKPPKILLIIFAILILPAVIRMIGFLDNKIGHSDELDIIFIVLFIIGGISYLVYWFMDAKNKRNK